MGRPVSFDFTTGGGSPEEFLMGTVHLEPTLMHTIGNTVVLPDAPYPVKLVNGKAVHPNVAVSPAGPEPTWAYKVTIENELTGKAWSEFRGIPTGTTQIAYKELPKFVTTIPPQTTAGMMQNWADTAQDGATRAEDAADRAEAPTDAMNASLIGNDASLTSQALGSAIRTATRFPLLYNAGALAGFRAELLRSRKDLTHIGYLADSIGTGVGVDGNASEIFPYNPAQQEAYRENALPYLMAEKLNDFYGTPAVPGWMGPAFSDVAGGGGWQSATTGYTSVSEAGAKRSASVGPFGGHVNAQRGGAAIESNAYEEWTASTLSRPFTAVDVYFYGEAAGVFSPTDPSIIVDGVTEYTATGTATGNFMKVTVSGLELKRHTIRVHNTTSGKTVYGAMIVARNDTGVCVSRIGSPGATTSDVVAADTTAQRDRVLAASVMPGDLDLLIIALSTNDQGAQLPLLTFKANLQLVIDASTCPVLLVDGPPRNNPVGPIMPAQYLAAMKELADANPSKVAVAALSAVFGDRASAVASGYFATASTVHPSFPGANRGADGLVHALVSSMSGS